MKEQEPYWHAAIHQIMPDLEIRSLVINHEGLVNDILIVNKAWVFRFTKGEYGRELLNLEYELMLLIGPLVSLSVPTPSIYNNKVIVYPYLNGETFYRNTWYHLEEEQQQKLADQLGKFLNELHSIPTKNLEWEIPMTLAPISYETSTLPGPLPARDPDRGLRPEAYHDEARLGFRDRRAPWRGSVPPEPRGGPPR